MLGSCRKRCAVSVLRELVGKSGRPANHVVYTTITLHLIKYVRIRVEPGTCCLATDVSR